MVLVQTPEPTLLPFTAANESVELRTLSGLSGRPAQNFDSDERGVFLGDVSVRQRLTLLESDFVPHGALWQVLHVEKCIRLYRLLVCNWARSSHRLGAFTAEGDGCKEKNDNGSHGLVGTA